MTPRFLRRSRARSESLPIEAWPDSGASLPPDAGPAIDAGFADSGVLADAAAAPDSEVAADAGWDSCDRKTLTPQTYAACCDALGWDWERGCQAWGPPAPPSLEVV